MLTDFFGNIFTFGVLIAEDYWRKECNPYGIMSDKKLRDRLIWVTLLLGVYCRPPDQEEEGNAAFYTQLKVATQSQALVIMGDFNHPHVCWKDHAARHMQSRRWMTFPWSRRTV